MSEITRIIAAHATEGVPLDALWAAAYVELKALAHARLYRDGRSTLLDTTALVNESYLKLAARKILDVGDRRQFMGYASRVMRSIIIDLAREQGSARRGGGVERVALATTIVDQSTIDDPLRVHEALLSLESVDPRLARVVEMRYFGGLDADEIAEALDLNVRTVGRDWDKARLLLRDLLSA